MDRAQALEKVRKLLALAANPGTPEEGKTARALAAELMKKHGIAQAEAGAAAAAAANAGASPSPRATGARVVTFVYRQFVGDDLRDIEAAVEFMLSRARHRVDPSIRDKHRAPRPRGWPRAPAAPSTPTDAEDVLDEMFEAVAQVFGRPRGPRAEVVAAHKAHPDRVHLAIDNSRSLCGVGETGFVWSFERKVAVASGKPCPFCLETGIVDTRNPGARVSPGRRR